MWTLPLPANAGCLNDVRIALTKKDGTVVFGVTELQMSHLEAIYARYDNQGGLPDIQLQSIGQNEEFLSAMYSAYDQTQEGGRLRHLRSSLKLSTSICPYCGFGEITDLDHHLPRSTYKTLAIYIRNLIPCCHACNGKKRANADLHPERQLLHTYYESPPDVEFLFAELVTNEHGFFFAFSIRESEQLPNQIHARLSFQFQKFELNERYQKQVGSFIASQRAAVEMLAENPEYLRQYLSKLYQNATRDFGRNDWRTAVWRCLSEEPSFYNGGHAAIYNNVLPPVPV